MKQITKFISFYLQDEGVPHSGGLAQWNGDQLNFGWTWGGLHFCNKFTGKSLKMTKCLNFESRVWFIDAIMLNYIWTTSSEFGTYCLCEQRRFRRACASAQSRQNLRCSLIQAVSQEEPSDRKPDPWSLWMAVHAQLKFVMTECSKTQSRLMGLIYILFHTIFHFAHAHFFCALTSKCMTKNNILIIKN